MLVEILNGISIKKRKNIKGKGRKGGRKKEIHYITKQQVLLT
jgi:hypothetical protein